MQRQNRNIKVFYDNRFSSKSITDYINGNRRVERQLQFLVGSIPRDVASVLVIGCGGGLSARHIATKCAKKARILAIDISSTAVEGARKLFRHNRITYVVADILKDRIEGKYEVIVLPDVYEHIELEFRNQLHLKINELLSDNGRIVLSCPSPYHQDFLKRERPSELQIVDEIVSLEDLIGFATDISGVVTYFSMISVWRMNDYIHAIIERETPQVNQPVDSLGRAALVSVKGFENKRNLGRVVFSLVGKLGWKRLLKMWRSYNVRRHLGVPGRPGK